jgi:deoxyribodipyrimidine photolyase-related protein
MKIFIVLPTQLFYKNILLNKVDCVYIIEDPFYFCSFKFHKLKLIFHRASMKNYYDDLINKYQVTYYNHYDDLKLDYNKHQYFMFNPIDKPMIYKYKQVKFIDTPMFLNTDKELLEYSHKLKSLNYRHKDFYEWQKSKLSNFTFDKSLDKENRKKFDKNYIIEENLKNYTNKYIIEAKKYVNKYFSLNYGSDENFIYPINTSSAKIHFNNFIKERFSTFGTYQDAISTNKIIASHSNISILLNTGLLTPKYIVKVILKTNAPDNSIEGYIRQIIGWREYMRFIYMLHSNDLLNFKYKELNKLKLCHYNATTNIEIVDVCIRKIINYGYLHHIERLMIMGNFFLFCKINPNEVYKWYMELFIDSFEWVMVANVFGMSQYCINKITIISKPYICSANYLLKMSDVKKGEWINTWNSLYYLFINDNLHINNYAFNFMKNKWLHKT